MRIGTQKPKEVLKKLEKEIAEVKTTEEFTTYLDFMSKFHSYSFNNQMLIAMQLPAASRVAGYKTWQTLGRQVRKGEKAIKILAPRNYMKEIENENGETEIINGIYFAWVNVFDVSQTDGEPLPEYNIETDESSDFFPNLELLCKECEVEIEFGDITAYGVSSIGKIQLKNGMSDSMNVSTAIHEIAHELLHDDTDRLQLSKRQIEFEAESICYVVCNYFGLPQMSAKYLATYGEYDLNNSLERISKTSDDIISRIENP